MLHYIVVINLDLLSIRLDRNELTDTGIHSLVEGLRECTSLRDLG